MRSAKEQPVTQGSPKSHRRHQQPPVILNLARRLLLRSDRPLPSCLHQTQGRAQNFFWGGEIFFRRWYPCDFQRKLHSCPGTSTLIVWNRRLWGERGAIASSATRLARLLSKRLAVPLGTIRTPLELRLSGEDASSTVKSHHRARTAASSFEPTSDSKGASLSVPVEPPASVLFTSKGPE